MRPSAPAPRAGQLKGNAVLGEQTIVDALAQRPLHATHEKEQLRKPGCSRSGQPNTWARPFVAPGRDAALRAAR
jgi:hypothetical protein